MVTFTCGKELVAHFRRHLQGSTNSKSGIFYIFVLSFHCTLLAQTLKIYAVIISLSDCKIAKSMEEGGEALLSKAHGVGDYFRHGAVELNSFSSCLKWLCVDQSNIWRATLSWLVFFILGIAVPIVSHFLLLCPDCDADHSRPYHIPVQFSLSILATISFLILSRWVRKYGLRKILFLDKISDASLKVHKGYAEQVQRSLKLILLLGLPCFIAECLYKIWWYVSGANEIPYYGNKYISSTILCILELCSWSYRTSIFFLLCIIFRLLCHLQLFQLEDYAHVFHKETDTGSILLDHLRTRRNLRIISHRFRGFLLSSLILVTASQFTFLLMTTRTRAHVNIYKAGELTLCSFSLVTGLLIILRSGAKITHKAQSTTALAAKWHVSATIDSYDNTDTDTPIVKKSSTQALLPGPTSESDEDEASLDEDDELDNAKFIPIYAHTMSFQNRQALVTYMENNRAGITVLGFMLDRTWLQFIFGIELGLCLWLLNKTIGIS